MARLQFHAEEPSTTTRLPLAPAATPRETLPLVPRLHPTLPTFQKALRRLRTPLPSRQKKRLALATTVLLGAFTLRWVDANRVAYTPPPPRPMVALGETTGINAAHFYAAAADAFTYRAGPTDVGSVKQLSEVIPGVAANAETLRLLREGLRHPYLGQQTTWIKTGPEPILNFIAQRELARLLISDATLKAEHGDASGAMQASLDTLQFGLQLGEGTSLIQGMIGQLIQGMTFTTADPAVAALSAAETRVALTRLQSLPAAPSLAALFENEKQTGLTQLAQLLENHDETTSKALFGPTTSGWQQRLVIDASILWFTKRGIVENYSQHMDALIQRAALPFAAAKALPPVAQPADLISQLLVPSVERARYAVTRNEAARAILTTRLALHLFQKEHGRLPAHLQELVAAGLLSQLPRDPFASTGDDALRYENGKVWTVGENGNDDRGTGDDILFPRP